MLDVTGGGGSVERLFRLQFIYLCVCNHGNDNLRSRMSLSCVGRKIFAYRIIIPVKYVVSIRLPIDIAFLLLSDWAHHGVYDNSGDSSEYKIARGFSYHQGPVSCLDLSYQNKTL